MRRTIVLYFILLSFFAVQGQEIKKETLLKRKPAQISRFHTANLQPNQFLLRMDFSQATIVNPTEFAHLYGKQIDRVELYYTTFRISDSFQQSSLNSQRLDELQKLIPDIYKQTGIQWRFIAQTGAKTPEEAQTYFHGFVITYREVEFLERKDEIRLMDSLSALLAAVVDTPTAVECRTITKTRKRWSGYYLPNSEKKREAGIRRRHRGLFARREKEYTYFHKTTTICDTSWGISGSFSGTGWMSDSSVTAILDRNMSKWKNAAVVTDVTGSMYPYVVQLQVWMRLNFHATDCRHFVFFNDGDLKPDAFKRTGNVGGVYATKASNYAAMEMMCRKAMSAGGGGDGQENNIEALLKAQKEFPECTQFIMIADNYAPVRDMRLLNKVTRPVHIILCGTQSGYVNAEYLEIARRTGGSVHTMEKDIENLAEMAEGAVIEIAGQRYQIQKGKFVLVSGT